MSGRSASLRQRTLAGIAACGAGDTRRSGPRSASSALTDRLTEIRAGDLCFSIDESHLVDGSPEQAVAVLGPAIERRERSIKADCSRRS
jgi:hypothetical protein